MRYPVVMDQWEEVYRQHARTDIPVLKTVVDLPMARFGCIAYAKRPPNLLQAVVSVAEDQADRVRYAESRPQPGKTLYWVEVWRLIIESLYRTDGLCHADTKSGYRVSGRGLALWLSEAEAEKFKAGEWPFRNSLCQRPVYDGAPWVRAVTAEDYDERAERTAESV